MEFVFVTSGLPLLPELISISKDAIFFSVQLCRPSQTTTDLLFHNSLTRSVAQSLQLECEGRLLLRLWNVVAKNLPAMLLRELLVFFLFGL
jgi:hypothetical protein